MNKTGGNFFEEHVEKMVLVIIAVVGMWLLLTRVVISPNYVEYDNKKFSSDDIDEHINQQANELIERINRGAEPKEPYEPQLNAFVAQVDSAISGINSDLSFVVPSITTIDIRAKSKYRLPVIGEINNVKIGYIRAVAYVPIEEISGENIYSADGSEPNDIDLVTVQGTFDVVKLYKEFYESFVGEEVPEQWRDPCLAEPIFAAADLQRQELLADGSWSR